MPVVTIQRTTNVVSATVAARRATVGGAGPQGPPGPAGPAGPGSEWVGVSGEAFSALRAVYVDVAGALRVWTAAAGVVGAMAGIARNSASAAGQNVDVVVAGELQFVGAGFTPGALYFVQANGSLGTSVPSTGAVQQVGVAKSADSLVVSPRGAIALSV